MEIDNATLSKAAQAIFAQETDFSRQHRFDTQPHLHLLGTGVDVVACAETVMAARITAPCLTLAPRIAVRTSTAMGNLYDVATCAPNFDWNCNPAGTDGELLAVEMLRSLVGLATDYSIMQAGLGKFFPHLNEALLLTYHSTTYAKPRDVSHKLVAYGVEPSLAKPFIVRNCDHRRGLPYTESFCADVDFAALRLQVQADLDQGLVPQLLILRPAATATLYGQLDQAKAVARQFDLILFLDLSRIGVQTLQPGLLSAVDADFVFLDLTEISHLSSGVLFLKDREQYAKNIVNPPQEYLQTPKGHQPAMDSTPTDAASKRLTEHEFVPHDFNVGFGNFVAWQRFLFFAMAKGKRGIAQELASQAKNVETISEKAKKLSFVTEQKTTNNAVYVRLKCKAQDLAKKFREATHFLPFESLGDSQIAVLHAPLDPLLETDLDDYFKRLTNIVESL